MFAQITKYFEELDIDKLAFETGFCKRRHQKITPADFILSFFLCYRSSRFSLRNWAVQLSNLIGDYVSHQAIDKKIQYVKVDFIKQVFAKVCLLKLNRIGVSTLSKLNMFTRVLIQDSTLVKLPDSHYDYSSGVSNGLVCKALTRIQVCVNLLTGNIVEVAKCSYSKNDGAYSDSILDILKPGDFVLRDLGYFTVRVFAKIIKAEAYFLSKLKSSVLIFDLESEQRIDLVAKLKQCDSLKVCELNIQAKIGNKDKLPVRICAVRLNQVQAASRRRQMIKSRHKNQQISDKAKYLCHWNILVTNIEDEQMNIQDLYQIYRLRWSIEIMFKNWKTNLKLNQLIYSSKTPNPARPEMLLHLMLLYSVLAYRPNYFEIARIIKKKFNRYLSPLKFATFLNNNITASLNLKSPLNIKLIKSTCCYDLRSDRRNSAEFYEIFNFFG